MKRRMGGSRLGTVREIPVDRRKEARIAVDAPVLINVLGADAQTPIPGRVLDLAEGSLKVAICVEIPAGSAVRAEVYDMLLLGEVCRSERSAEGFNVVFKITHSLGALAELERLNRALMGETRRRESVAEEALVPVSRSAS